MCNPTLEPANPPDDEPPSGVELIAALRGGIPERCDFCGHQYTDARYPVPEEAGLWACIECVKRWALESS